MFVHPAFVTYTDGMCVVVQGMHPDFLFITSLVHMTVLFDVIVVADALVVEAGVMTFPQLFNREPPVAARSAAVNNNKIDFSHLDFIKTKTLNIL